MKGLGLSRDGVGARSKTRKDMQCSAIQVQMECGIGTPHLCGVDVLLAKDKRVKRPDLYCVQRSNDPFGLGLQSVEAVRLVATNADDDCPGVVAMGFARSRGAIRHQIQRGPVLGTAGEPVNEFLTWRGLAERRRLPHIGACQELQRVAQFAERKLRRSTEPCLLKEPFG